MRSRGIAVVAALTAVLSAGPAQAGSFSCPIDMAGEFGMYSTGDLFVTGSGKTIFICNVGTTVSGVSPDTCKAWFSSVLTWRTAGLPGRMYFNIAGKTACSDFSHFTLYVPDTLNAQP